MSSLERVCKTIEKVRGLIEADGVLRSAADVRAFIVTPLLKDLGWDSTNPESVRREYVVTGGKGYFFDYALLAPDRAVALAIAASALGRVDTDARDQLLSYTVNTKTNLGLATDGRTWSIYLPLGDGSPEDRLVCAVDLRVDSAESAGRVLLRYLARDRVLSGRAHRAAYRDLASLALDRIIWTGWADLLDGPSDRLVKTIAAAARAVAVRNGASAPSGRTLNEAIRAFIGRGFSFPVYSPVPTASPPPKKVTRGVSWTFRNERRTERNPTDLYVAVVGRLYQLRGPIFYRQLQDRIRGRTRAQIAETPEGTGVPEQVRSLPGGWCISTNLSTADKLRYLRRACDVAGVAFGSELVIELDGERLAEPRS